MDNLTHSLTGLALARAGLNRYCPHAAVLLVLSANAPDCDIVALAGGSLSYLEAHRGYSHTVLGMPFMAALSVAVVALVYRKTLPWLKAWLLCCIGVASHLVIDLTNSYGIRLLLPFSSRWDHLDLNSLWDGIILGVLVVAALWPSLVRLVANEIGDQRPVGPSVAIAALGFVLLFDVGRAVLHARANAELQSRIYDGMPPLQTAALPDRFNPLQWTGIVETENSYRILPISSIGANLDSDRDQEFFKPAMDKSLEAAKSTEAFRYFLYFSRFPVWSRQATAMDKGQGVRIDLTDLRFGTPSTGSFHCIALEDQRSELLNSWFTFGSGGDLGSAEDQRAERDRSPQPK